MNLLGDKVNSRCIKRTSTPQPRSSIAIVPPEEYHHHQDSNKAKAMDTRFTNKRARPSSRIVEEERTIPAWTRIAQKILFIMLKVTELAIDLLYNDDKPATALQCVPDDDLTSWNLVGDGITTTLRVGDGRSRSNTNEPSNGLRGGRAITDGEHRGRRAARAGRNRSSTTRTSRAWG